LDVKEILLGPTSKGPGYQMIRVWGSGKEGISSKREKWGRFFGGKRLDGLGDGR
jgi:hypothetical protein